MSRTRRTAALAVAVTALAGACGEADDIRPAAVVDGTEIAQQDVVDELEAIAANTAYLESLQGGPEAPEGGGTRVLGEEDGTFDAAFTNQVLSLQISLTLVRNEVEARGLVVDDACRDAARENFTTNLIGPGIEDVEAAEAVFNDFDEGYRTRLVERNAAVLALQADGIGQPCALEDREVAYFEDNADDFAQVCLSHILVETLDEAIAIEAELAAGAEFEAIATERSTDPGSGAQGGSLGCEAAGALPYVEPFAAAAGELEVGELSAPVETEFGFHLIRLDSEGTPSDIDEVRDQVAGAVGRAASAAFGEFFDAALAESEVDVDPRYGTWDPAQAAVVPNVDSTPTEDPATEDPATEGTGAPTEDTGAVTTAPG